MKSIEITHKQIIFLASALIVVFMWLIFPSKAHATNWYPGAANSSQDPRAIVSRNGDWSPEKNSDGSFKPGGYYNCQFPANFPGPPDGTGPNQDPGACTTGLRTGETRYKVFRPDDNSSVDITLLDICRQDSNTTYDKPGQPDKGYRDFRVTFWTTHPNGAKKEQKGSAYSEGNCGAGKDLNMTIEGGTFTNAQDGKYGDKVETALVVIERGSDNPGQELFQLRVLYAGGFVYGDDNGGDTDRHFSIASQTENGKGAYTFVFKADCRANDGTAKLGVRDIDYFTEVPKGSGNYLQKDPTITVSITGDGYSFSSTQADFIRGNGQEANFKIDIPALIPGREYTITITSIDNSNGLNVSLPFSEFKNFNPNDCGESPEELVSACNSITYTMPSNGLTLPSGEDPDKRRIAIWVNDSGTPGGPSGTYNDGDENIMPGDIRDGQEDFYDKDMPEGATRTWDLAASGKIVSGTLHYTIVVYNVYKKPNNPNKGDDRVKVWKRISTPAEGIGPCYRAECSIQISQNVPTAPGGSNAVRAGNNFTARLTLRNKGINTLNQPREGTSTRLAVTADNWFTWPYESPGSLAPEGQPGDTRSWDVTIGAPEGIGSHTLNMYPDYWQGWIFGPIGDACPTTIHTYQPWRLDPSVSSVVVTPDPEDPVRFEYNTQVSQASGADPDYGVTYTSSSIPATVNNRLVYFNTALSPPPAEDPPFLHDQNYSDNYGSRTFGPGDGLFYDDTTFGRNFVHGGETDTWKPGDKVCGRIGIDRHKGWLGPGGSMYAVQPLTVDGAGCETIENRPFVRIYGSDVFAGGTFGAPGSASLARILAYTKDPFYGAGSGVEFGAFSFGNINGFTSASLRTGSPTSPSGLSFAGPPNGDSLFGGDFSSSRGAVDYYNDTREAETVKETGVGSVNLSSNVDAQPGRQRWISNPLVSVNDSAATYNKRHTLYVEGDVVIRENIIYPTSGWGSIATIPSNWIIVKGNIYIDRGVTDLDGLFVAQPLDDGTKGRIYTCTDGANIIGEASLYASCGNKLQVNGAFVSQETRFLRTANTLSDIPATPPTNPIPPETDSFSWYHFTPPPSILPNCVRLVETSEESYKGWNDNYICANRNVGLQWEYRWTNPPPDGYSPSDVDRSGQRCTYFDNPSEDVEPAGSEDDDDWGDNYMCTSAAFEGIDIQYVYGASNRPVGKTCLRLYEPWDSRWPNSDSSTTSYLCYRSSWGGSQATPAAYRRETFDGPFADHAAESFRLGPEFYLAQPVTRPTGSQSNGKYDYVISLPPLL